MTQLSDLSLEIRILIIEYVGLGERQPTYDSTIVATYEAAQAFGPGYCSRKNVHKILYEDNGENNRPNVINLLLTSRQMRNATEDCLARTECICKVDVAIMHSSNIWPTFTCIPPKRRKIDTVEATIHDAGDGPPCLQDWVTDGDEMAPIAAQFWRLLRNFVDEGPCIPSWAAPSSGSTGPRHRTALMTTIGLLDVDVMDSDPLCDNAWTDHQSATSSIRLDTVLCRQCDTLCRVGSPKTAYVGLDAEFVFERLRMGFQVLLTGILGFYGLSLYTRVGSIRMRMRGMISGEIDLGEVLNNLPLNGMEDIMPFFIKWTKKQRKQNGLSCPDESKRTERLSAEKWQVFLKDWCRNAIPVNSTGV